jgi:hypothetical protein
MLHAMLFRTFFQSRFFTERKNNALDVQTIRHMKLFTTCLSRTKNVRKSILLRHNMQKTSIYLSKKNHFVWSRLSVAARVMTTSSSRVCRLLLASYDLRNLMINNIAFIFLSYSFSYIKRDSSRKIWTKNKTIDRDMWRLRLADAA